MVTGVGDVAVKPKAPLDINDHPHLSKGIDLQKLA